MRGVVLIGLRGAGKTTVGVLLAQRLELPFQDSDAVVEEQTGSTVSELLEQGVFRLREVQVLADLLSGPSAVIAAGGGAVLWDGFRAAAAGWVVVWLDADAEVLAARIAGSDRPSLTGQGIAAEVGEVARARSSLYGAAARVRFDTGGHDSETVAQKIHALLKDEAQASFDSAD